MEKSDDNLQGGGKAGNKELPLIGYHKAMKPFRPLIWILLTFGATGFVLDAISNSFVFLVPILSPIWVNLLGVFLIAIVGIGLYVLRERKRIIYGGAEVGFALAYGWYAINKVTSVGYVETVSVIAAIYLVVRGLDNIMEGWKKKVAEAIVDDAKQLQTESQNKLSATT